MPRRNSNAEYHRPRWNHDRVYFLRDEPETSKRDLPGRPILKNTAEQIVRDYRTHSAQRSALSDTPKAGPFKVAWYKAVNWKAVFDFGCWIGVGVAVGYLTVRVFIPFFVLLMETYGR